MFESIERGTAFIRERFDEGLSRLVPIATWWPSFITGIADNLGRLDPPTPRPEPAPLPAGFPSRVPVLPVRIQSFDGLRRAPAIWHAIPWTKQDVVAIAQWATANGFLVRPRGKSHSWSPMQVAGPSARHAILVDLRRMQTMRLAQDRRSGRFSAGLTIEQISRFLDRAGLALPMCPAVGEVTLGGVLAVGGHGTGVTHDGRRGGTMGSLVRSLEVLCEDPNRPGTYRFEEVSREHEPSRLSALAVSLGSAFISEVTLGVESSRVFSVRSGARRMDQYFGAKRPGRARTPATLSEELAGRCPNVELLWEPSQGDLRRPEAMQLVRRGWRPRTHRSGDALQREPYRDRLVNWAVHDTDDAVRRALRWAQPKAGRRARGERLQGILRLSTRRPDKHLSQHAAQLYSSRYILRFHAASWCCIVERHAVGRMLTSAAKELAQLLQRHGNCVDGPVEVRITDPDPPHVALSSARVPPGVDPASVVAVWFSVLATLDPTHAAGIVLHGLERWMIEVAPTAGLGVLGVRPEWSKGAAYDEKGRPWRAADALAYYRRQYQAYPQHGLDDVFAVFDALDPSRRFRSPIAQILAGGSEDDATSVS
ncbi:MAG: FAD-binding protein [Myxococcota bacterium]